MADHRRTKPPLAGCPSVRTFADGWGVALPSAVALAFLSVIPSGNLLLPLPLPLPLPPPLPLPLPCHRPFHHRVPGAPSVRAFADGWGSHSPLLLPLPFFLSFPPGICFFLCLCLGPCHRPCHHRVPGAPSVRAFARWVGSTLPKNRAPSERPLPAGVERRNDPIALRNAPATRSPSPSAQDRRTLSSPLAAPNPPNPLSTLAIYIFKTWHSYPHPPATI
jgi:hypothetical protein